MRSLGRDSICICHCECATSHKVCLCFCQINSFWALFCIFTAPNAQHSIHLPNDILGAQPSAATIFTIYGGAKPAQCWPLPLAHHRMETISRLNYSMFLLLLLLCTLCVTPMCVYDVLGVKQRCRGIANGHTIYIFLILLRVFGRQIQCLHII